MKKYYPILVSKKGEQVALQHLTQDVKDDLCPVIEVLYDSIIKKVKSADKLSSTSVYSDKLAKYFATHWSFFNNEVQLDFSLFENLEQEILNVQKLIKHMLTSSVNVVPVIQFNSNEKYLSLVEDIVKNHGTKVSIRISNSSGFLQVFGDIKKLLKRLNITHKSVTLIFDLSQVSKDDYNTKAAIANAAIKELPYPVNEWGCVVVASSSFPGDMNNVNRIEEGDTLPRYEWILWNTLKELPHLKEIQYGDYGTKSAIYEDLHYIGTVTLKYTKNNNYWIFKGQKAENHDYGNRQFIIHTESLVSSDCYCGAQYSWGDMKYDELSELNASDEETKPGNPTNWVSYSQNHHMTHQLDLLSRQ